MGTAKIIEITKAMAPNSRAYGKPVNKPVPNGISAVEGRTEVSTKDYAADPLEVLDVYRVVDPQVFRDVLAAEVGGLQLGEHQGR